MGVWVTIGPLRLVPGVEQDGPEGPHYGVVVISGKDFELAVNADEAEMLGHNMTKIAAMARGKANSANRRPKGEPTPENE